MYGTGYNGVRHGGMNNVCCPPAAPVAPVGACGYGGVGAGVGVGIIAIAVLILIALGVIF